MPRSLLALALLGCLLLQCTGAALVYNLSVDATSGVDSPTCNSAGSTPAVACRSIGYAIAPLTQGDFLALYLSPGVYSGSDNTNLQLAYTQLRFIGVVIGDQRPVIDCGNTQTAASVSPLATQEYSFTNVDFRNCRSTLGGAVNVLSGISAVTFTNCGFSNNRASQSGGAIYTQQQVTVVSCTFTNNSAAEHGGAIAAQNVGAFRVSFSTFSYNSADIGGAIYGNNLGTSASPIVLNNNVFTNNTVTSQGGAFFATSTGERKYDFFGTVFDNNCASSPYSDPYDVQVRCASDVNCTIVNKGNSSGCLDTYKPPPPTDSGDGGGVSNRDKAIIIGVTVPFGILAILSVALFLYIRKKHNAEMAARDEYRKKILKALENLPPEEQEAARLAAEQADPNSPKCQLCQIRNINAPLPCGHEVVCSVCRTILLECPVKGCKRPTR